MKKLALFHLVLFLLVNSYDTTAQIPDFANSAELKQIHSDHMRESGRSMDFFFPGKDWSRRVPKTHVERKSKLHVFRILFKDSTVSTLNGTIDMYQNRFFLAINNGISDRSIPANQTLSITRVDQPSQQVGFATDSCWLFKSPGTINAYSVLSEDDIDFTIAIQEGDGPIIPLTKKNLAGMMREYFPSTQELLKEGKLHHALLQYNKLSARKRSR